MMSCFIDILSEAIQVYASLRLACCGYVGFEQQECFTDTLTLLYDEVVDMVDTGCNSKVFYEWVARPTFPESCITANFMEDMLAWIKGIVCHDPSVPPPPPECIEDPCAECEDLATFAGTATVTFDDGNGNGYTGCDGIAEVEGFEANFSKDAGCSFTASKFYSNTPTDTYFLAFYVQIEPVFDEDDCFLYWGIKIGARCYPYTGADIYYVWSSQMPLMGSSVCDPTGTATLSLQGFTVAVTVQ